MSNEGEALLEPFVGQRVRIVFARDFEIAGVLREIGYDGSVLIDREADTTTVPTWVPVQSVCFIGRE
jgi:hypothetical protein